MSEGKHDIKTHAKKEPDVKAKKQAQAPDAAETGKDAGKRNKKKSKGRKVLRALLILILVLAAAVAGLVYRYYRQAEASLDLKFAEDSATVEFGDEVPAMDRVSEWTWEIEPAQRFLETDSLGAKSLVYRVYRPLFGGLLTPSKEFTLDYLVVDTKAPLTLWSGDGAVLERGTEFDIKNVIAYGDNADPAPEVKVEGEVDMSTEGSYPLHVTVTDASGNSTDWDLTVDVADELPSYEDNSERTAFSDFASSYGGNGKVIGIDVSAWQDEVDFDAVKAAGCEFVIIRIGYSEDGQMTVDKRFDENIKKARAAGIKTGVYLYTTDNTEEEIRTSADQLIEKLGGEPLDLPVAFDWEDFGSFQSYEMSFHDLNRLYDAFADQLSQSGYECMLYGSKNYLEKVWENTDTRPVWLAHYTDETDYKGPFYMWQASCTGRIDGINGDVDMDVMYN